MTHFKTFFTSVVLMTPSFSSPYSSTPSTRNKAHASLISDSSSAEISFSLASLDRRDFDADTLGLLAAPLLLDGVFRGG